MEPDHRMHSGRRGCRNCYAMHLAGTRLAQHPSRRGLTRQNAAGHHVWTGEVRLNEEWIEQPLRWSKPRMIFVCAHGDLFHDSVPDDWIDRVFAAMALAPRHVFQVLTKRPARMRKWFRSIGGTQRRDWVMAAVGRQLGRSTVPAFQWPLRNVWLGVSTENQMTADERIPLLLDTPAHVRWISAEPLLGELDIEPYLSPAWRSEDGSNPQNHKLNWVVVGGESGHGARPMHPNWVRSLRDQCEAADVAFHFKQWGEWDSNALAYTDTQGRNPPPNMKIGKKKAGRLLDGVEHNGMPERV